MAEKDGGVPMHQKQTPICLLEAGAYIIQVKCCRFSLNTVKILKIGTPEIITIIVLQLEQLDFTVQCCV